MQAGDTLPRLLGSAGRRTWQRIPRRPTQGNPEDDLQHIGTYGYAKLANDGNTSRRLERRVLAHTGSEVNPYWELDLGGLRGSMPSDMEPHRLLHKPAERLLSVCHGESNGFTSVDPAVLANDATVWDKWVSGEAGRPTILTVGQYGRKLRIQRETGSTATVMNIAEVQVYGRPGTPDQWPKAISKTDDENFDLTGGPAPQRPPKGPSLARLPFYGPKTLSIRLRAP
jgi:hypothetical protein